jgi:peptidoglycan/LPS O-acetylase OafA/YrhL
VLRTILLPALAVAGVIVSVAMVVIGYPEANGVQTVLLELSSLPLSFAVAVGIVILDRRAVRPLGRRTRRVLLTGLGFIALGLLMMMWAYLPGPRELVHVGQLLVWIGLFAGLLVTIRRLPRRRFTSYHVVERDTGDEGAEDPADSGQTPSL